MLLFSLFIFIIFYYFTIIFILHGEDKYVHIWYHTVSLTRTPLCIELFCHWTILNLWHLTVCISKFLNYLIICIFIYFEWSAIESLNLMSISCLWTKLMYLTKHFYALTTFILTGQLILHAELIDSASHFNLFWRLCYIWILYFYIQLYWRWSKRVISVWFFNNKFLYTRPICGSWHFYILLLHYVLYEEKEKYVGDGLEAKCGSKLTYISAVTIHEIVLNENIKNKNVRHCVPEVDYIPFSIFRPCLYSEIAKVHSWPRTRGILTGRI